jgi:hypothetical protein
MPTTRFDFFPAFFLPGLSKRGLLSVPERRAFGEVATARVASPFVFGSSSCCCARIRSSSDACARIAAIGSYFYVFSRQTNPLNDPVAIVSFKPQIITTIAKTDPQGARLRHEIMLHAHPATQQNRTEVVRMRYKGQQFQGITIKKRK